MERVDLLLNLDFATHWPIFFHVTSLRELRQNVDLADLLLNSFLVEWVAKAGENARLIQFICR